MTPELTTQQWVANFRSLVARHLETERKLAAAADDNAWLRAKLRDRPTRPAYEELAKKCAHLEKENERLRELNVALGRRNRDLGQTIERVTS